jgi:hypothetical protein
MVTLALTGIVPKTVDPEPGEVMLTIRLLSSCAEAWGDVAQAPPKIAKRTADLASLTEALCVLVMA